MINKANVTRAAVLWLCTAGTSFSWADIVVLRDGQRLTNCYVRDEGTHIQIWRTLDDVGKAPETYPRGEVREYKVEREADWDKKPALPDLTITFIEMNPKLPGLHGRVQYDEFGRPKIAGADVLKDLGEEAYMKPEEVVQDVKLKRQAGDLITLTGHVRNIGFKPAPGFTYEWLIDGQRVDGGKYDKPLAEMAIATFDLKWKWQDGRHTATFRVKGDYDEIATINNELNDPLWGLSFVFIVNPGRVDAWHQFRSAYGTFSFEDFYRWHVDIMNRLFAESVFPALPDGIIARVRLDRIVYTTDTAQAEKIRLGPDNLLMDQGAWVWTDSPKELETGEWIQINPEWRNRTEWSLPHELGHQLGLTDWYALDYEGQDAHVTPDTGEKITHFMRHAVQMMHWHGPQTYGEVDAGYLNMTMDKPRGYFGDHYFAIPDEVWLSVVDVNGRGVPDARVEVFQRGVKLDPAGKPVSVGNTKYWPVIEDGDFGPPVSAEPVIAGVTDADGRLQLPNRPVKEVRTLNGFYRKANAFGNINVVGQRGLLLIQVTQGERVAPFWIEVHQCLKEWFRGNKERVTFVLKTPFGSADSPPAPTEVRAKKTDEKHAVVTWSPPDIPHQQDYLKRVLGYRVYRRIGNDGLNDRPWFPVATVGPETTSVSVDLSEFPQDIYWYSKTERFAVSTLGDCSVESELVETVLPRE